MAMRISDSGKTITALDNIYQNSSSLDNIVNKLSSGKNITKVHEDPITAQRAMFFRNIQNENKQYLRNGEDAKSFLDITETALDNTGQLLNRVKELATTAANGTINTQSRTAISQELNQIIAEIGNIANQQFNGKYIFSGNKTLTQPITIAGDPPASVTYNGDSGKTKYQISSTSSIEVNIPGDEVFTGIIQNIISLRDNVDAGNVTNISNNDLVNIDSSIDTVLANRTEIGAKTQVANYSMDRMQDNDMKVEELLSNTEDLDMAKAITDMQLAENQYKTSLSVISKIQSMSLADFLK